MIWIQFIVFFILGATITAFLMVLFFPLVWRRALYLANKAVRMENPVSLHEIEVERDFLRAEHATKTARLEEMLKVSENRYAAILLECSHLRENNHNVTLFKQSLDMLAGLDQQLNNEIISIKTDLYKENASSQSDEQIQVLPLAQDLMQIQAKFAHLEEINQEINLAIKDLQDKITVKTTEVNHSANNDIVDITAKNDLPFDVKNLLAKNENLQIEQNVTRDLLREQIKMMAAIFVSHIAMSDKEGSTIVKLINKAESTDSLASLIQKNIKNYSNSNI